MCGRSGSPSEQEIMCPFAGPCISMRHHHAPIQPDCALRFKVAVKGGKICAA